MADRRPGCPPPARSHDGRAGGNGRSVTAMGHRLGRGLARCSSSPVPVPSPARRAPEVSRLVGRCLRGAGDDAGRQVEDGTGGRRGATRRAPGSAGRCWVLAARGGRRALAGPWRWQRGRCAGASPGATSPRRWRPGCWTARLAHGRADDQGSEAAGSIWDAPVRRRRVIVVVRFDRAPRSGRRRIASTPGVWALTSDLRE